MKSEIKTAKIADWVFTKATAITRNGLSVAITIALAITAPVRAAVITHRRAQPSLETLDVEGGEKGEARACEVDVRHCRLRSEACKYRQRQHRDEHRSAEALEAAQPGKVTSYVVANQLPDRMRSVGEHVLVGRCFGEAFDHLCGRQRSYCVGRTQDFAISTAAADDHKVARHNPMVDPDGKVGRQTERGDAPDLHASRTRDCLLRAGKGCFASAEPLSDHTVYIEAGRCEYQAAGHWPVPGFPDDEDRVGAVVEGVPIRLTKSRGVSEVRVARHQFVVDARRVEACDDRIHSLIVALDV